MSRGAIVPDRNIGGVINTPGNGDDAVGRFSLRGVQVVVVEDGGGHRVLGLGAVPLSQLFLLEEQSNLKAFLCMYRAV
jgi:hypothetical protein